MENPCIVKKENRAARKAFTLVELLITIVVSALVLNGVIMSLVNSMVLNEYNQGFTSAMNIARAQMENILSQSSNLSLINSKTVVLDTAKGDPVNGLYSIIVTDIGLTAANPAANELKNVKIAVCWKARGGRIIGDCKVGTSGNLEWKTPQNPSSPCTLETAIAAH